MKTPNTLLANTGTTIFTVMSALATEHGAINLGQGFPDTEGPADVVRAAADALLDNRNQYPPLTGVLELRQAVAVANKRFYDTYLPVVRLLGAIPKLVRLQPPNWDLPRDELAAAFGPKTKAILFNSPMNPTGKVFTIAELAFIADLVQRHDCYAICDEVYEHLTFDGWKHIPLMTLPGMRERCLRISSAGKTFSLTGWKIGYVSGDASLIPLVAKAHQNLTFTTPPNLQRAVAVGLAKGDEYFASLSSDLQARRDRLANGLAELGFGVLPTHGSYFVSADFSHLGLGMDDVAFCRHITEHAKVAAIPVSAFYEGDAPRHYARFAFCKKFEVLDEALARLGNFVRSRQLTQAVRSA